MACVDELHVGDIGTSIELEITECDSTGTSAVDITTADSLTVRFQKVAPTYTVIERIGTIYTGGTNGDGTDGIVQYITVAGDIDQVGKWKIQAIVDFPVGSKFHSSIVKMSVKDNLEL